MDFSKVQFMLSAHSLGQLPDPIYPDIAFAGRSNVGKSSLINRLVRRANLVKTSSRPGKTQSLNYFLVDEGLYLVDLPGYGFAQVSQQTSLVCMVVIIDLRHELKKLDRELIDWLRYLHKPFLPVYTKADKLGRNDQRKNAALLDAGLTLTPADRIIFSSRTGQGLDQLKTKIAALVTGFQGSDEAADNDLTDPI
jgi:GTP-binding protein